MSLRIRFRHRCYLRFVKGFIDKLLYEMEYQDVPDEMLQIWKVIGD